MRDSRFWVGLDWQKYESPVRKRNALLKSRRCRDGLNFFALVVSTGTRIYFERFLYDVRVCCGSVYIMALQLTEICRKHLYIYFTELVDVATLPRLSLSTAPCRSSWKKILFCRQTKASAMRLHRAGMSPEVSWTNRLCASGLLSRTCLVFLRYLFAEPALVVSL